MVAGGAPSTAHAAGVSGVTLVPKRVAQDPRQVPEPQGAGGKSSSEKTTGPEALKLPFSLQWDVSGALEKLLKFPA